MQFPIWMYHKTQEARIFTSEEELKAAGKGWVHNPAKLNAPVDEEPDDEAPDDQGIPVNQDPEDVARIRAKAKELHIKNWHNKKPENLAAEIAEYEAGQTNEE